MKLINSSIWLMVIVALFQSLFSALVKLLGHDITTGVAVLSYYMIPLLFLLPLCLHSKGALLKTDKLGFLFLRGMMASGAVFCFFYAASHIHLAIAAVLFNSMPIFVALLARIFLKEVCSKQVWASIIIALIGICIVIHPSLSGFFKLGSLVGLAAALLMAISQVMLRNLVKQKMPTTQIVFYLYLMCSLSAGLIILLESLITHHSLIVIHSGGHILFIISVLLLLGISSLISQRTMTYAFQFMSAAKLVPILFISVPASSLIGWFFWHQHLSLGFYIGGLLIFIGTLLITFDKRSNEVARMKLGKTKLAISRQGLGCMSISEFYGAPLEEREGITLIKTAFRSGVNFFDTADAYAFGKNEVLLGKAIAELLDEGVRREQIIIASKCGIIRDEHDRTKRGINNSYEYVKHCCHASLEKLGPTIRSIDLYYLHRIADGGRQLDEAMKAMAELLEGNQIKAVGLSEANREMIETANAALLKYTAGKHQIAAIQTEYSLMTRIAERNGVLDFCKANHITFVAYSPLSRALLTGDITDPAVQLDENDFRRTLPRFQQQNLAKNQIIVNTVARIARNKQCSTAQVALAWVLHQQGVVPIPGTTKIEHLKANITAQNISFTSKELEELNALEPAQGYRYTEAAMRTYGFDDELELDSSPPSII